MTTHAAHVARRERLRVTSVEFESDVDGKTLARLHEAAHERCFIANSVSCPVEVAA